MIQFIQWLHTVDGGRARGIRSYSCLVIFTLVITENFIRKETVSRLNRAFHKRGYIWYIVETRCLGAILFKG